MFELKSDLVLVPHTITFRDTNHEDFSGDFTRSKPYLSLPKLPKMRDGTSSAILDDGRCLDLINK